jgi:hypothetical protein
MEHAVRFGIMTVRTAGCSCGWTADQPFSANIPEAEDVAYQIIERLGRNHLRENACVSE